MKKQSNLSQLLSYAGGRKYLTYLSLLLSAVSAVLALFPFVFLFFIIREIIEAAPNYAQATQVVHNGWMAVAFAVASILIYLVALMCSHLSAFRIAGNIRKALMAHIAELPFGPVLYVPIIVPPVPDCLPNSALGIQRPRPLCRLHCRTSR